MATNDDQIVEILAEMTDSQPIFNLSPVKSPPKRQREPDDHEAPPNAQPKRQKTSFSSLRNQLSHFESRRHKAVKSLHRLREHQSKSTMPSSLRYNPRPYIRQDKNFQAEFQQICSKAEQQLLDFLIQQQTLNISSDTEVIDNLKTRLKDTPEHVKKQTVYRSI